MMPSGEDVNNKISRFGRKYIEAKISELGIDGALSEIVSDIGKMDADDASFSVEGVIHVTSRDVLSGKCQFNPNDFQDVMYEHSDFTYGTSLYERWKELSPTGKEQLLARAIESKNVVLCQELLSKIVEFNSREVGNMPAKEVDDVCNQLANVVIEHEPPWGAYLFPLAKKQVNDNIKKRAILRILDQEKGSGVNMSLNAISFILKHPQSEEFRKPEYEDFFFTELAPKIAESIAESDGEYSEFFEKLYSKEFAKFKDRADLRGLKDKGKEIESNRVET